MKAAACIAAALTLATVSCGKEKSSETKLRRSGGKAAVVVVGAEEANAAQGLAKEVEPNNEPAQAQGLRLGAGALGTLDQSTDVDRYQFETVSEGQLFAKVTGAEDADLILELQKVDGSVLAASDRGPKATAEGVSGYWLEAKMSYQLVVREFTKRKQRKGGGRAGVSAPYRLTIALDSEARPDHEVEPNDDLEGARELGIGTPEHGFLGWSGDIDWWRLPVSGFSEVALDAEGAMASPRTALDIVVSGMPKVATQVELSTSSGETIATLSSAVGKEVAFRSFVPAVGADFYVVKLRSKRSNPEESYQVLAESRTLGAGQEAEPNNAIELANVIASEVGVLAKSTGEVSMGDVDMFSLPPASMNRSLDLRLVGPSTADLTVSVVSERGELLAIGDKPGLGLSESLQAVNVAPNTSPIVIVRAAKVDLPAAYELSLSLSEGQGVPQAPVAPAEESTESME